MYGMPPPGAPPAYYQPPTTAPEWLQQQQQQQQQQQPTSAGHPWQGAGQMAQVPPPLPPRPTSQPDGNSYQPSIYGPMPPTHGLSSSNDPNSAAVAHPGGFGTTQWGVKYNQQQQYHDYQQQYHPQGQIPPALPPRPDGSWHPPQAQSPPVQETAWAPPNQQQPPPNHQQQPYYPPSHHPNPPDYQPQWQPQQPYAGHGYDTNQQIPPPPPPLPPAYQSEVQQQQQQQQQQQHQQQPQQYQSQSPGWPSPATQHVQPPGQPPVYHYPPPQPQHGAYQEQPNITGQQSIPGFAENTPPSHPPRPDSTHQFHYTPPPQGGSAPPPTTSPQQVSPIPAPAVPPPAQSTSPTAPSASALGPGGPSDWEHFEATGQDVGDAQKPEDFKQSSELPTGPSPTQTQTESQGHSGFPGAAVGQTVHDNAAKVGAPQKATTASSEQQPRPPERIDSDTSAVSPDGIIDNVIEAWSRPVASDVKPLSHASQQPQQRQEHPPRAGTSPSPSDQPRVATPPSQTQVTPQQSPSTAISSKVEKPTPSSVMTIVDPYEDLDPWYKSSLTRYVTMLRKEMETESEQEKFKIFTSFMTKESKLREILYNIENVQEPTEKPIMQQRSEKEVTAAPQKQQPARGGEAPSPEETDDVVAFSPGGRPILGSALSNNNNQTDQLQRSTSNPSSPAQRKRGDTLSLPGRSEAASLGGSSSPSNHSRSTSVPPETDPPATTQPSQPAYTPFRYTEGPQRGSEPLTFDRPAHQAYSALRLASAESGRVMSHSTAQSDRDGAPDDDIPSNSRQEHEFVGLVRAKSVAYGLRPPNVSSTPRPSSTDPLKRGIASAIIDELRALTPSSPPSSATDDPKVFALKGELEKWVDGFSFISKSLDAWDRGAGERAAAMDKHRQQRQEESEHHIDALFNDKEIGYSDINVLENEFKQTEAQKQLNEERKEFDKFVEIVFGRVDGRLQNEVSELRKLYDQAIQSLEAETSDGDGDDDDKGQPKPARPGLSQAMKNAADAFQKLELRYEKRVEAVLERERRQRKAERRYFVFLGDSAALKKVDKDFDNREARIQLDAAKRKDERANQLMDSFDEASMRGIGKNQRLLDEISTKMEKLDEGLVNSMDGAESGARMSLEKTLEFVRLLEGECESILRSFVVADRMLNDADYGVSVAEAKMAHSNADIFRRLEEEKKKEDQKIDDDLESRISSLKRGYEGTLTAVQTVLGFMQTSDETKSGTAASDPGADKPATTSTPTPASGTSNTASGDGKTKQPSPSPYPRPGSSPPRPPSTTLSSSSPAPSAPPSAEQERQERMRKALEDAKKRNAARVTGS